MKENAIFKKALRLLAHPASLLAVCFYGLNTFVLQRICPNWLTGKLGDLAWVFVAPLVFTALLSWLLPERQRRAAFTVSMIGTAIVFTLIKATSLNSWLVTGLAKFTGSPFSVVRDTSDLLALLVLPVTLCLWVRPQVVLKTRSRAGLALMALFTLFTVADSAVPNLGITSIDIVDHTILACNSYYSSFQSSDDGQTWQDAQQECTQRVYSAQYGANLQDPNNEQIQYKFRPGLIERSTDGGNTWQVDYQWPLSSEAEQLYYITSNQVYNSSDLPPFSGVVDPRTGEVFFAMGHEGILKRASGATPNYGWIAVGENKKHDYQKSALLINLLYGEWMLAICAGCAGAVLLDIKLKPGKLKVAFLTLGLIGMVVCVLFFPPAQSLTQSYISQFLPMGLLIVLLLMLSLAGNAFFNAGMNSKRRLFLSIAGFLVITILAFLPFALWVYNLIPYHGTALFAAGVVAVAGIILLQMIARLVLPVEIPKLNG